MAKKKTAEVYRSPLKSTLDRKLSGLTVIAILSIAAVFVVSGFSLPGSTLNRLETRDIFASSTVNEMLTAHNRERTSRGLQPLTLDSKLSSTCAQSHSNLMSDYDDIFHRNQGYVYPDGSVHNTTKDQNGVDRDDAGNPPPNGSKHISESTLGNCMSSNSQYTISGFYGENVGVGPDVNSVHNKFMDSPKHRDNILEPTYRYVGIALNHKDGVDFWTLNFYATDQKAPDQKPGDGDKSGGGTGTKPGPDVTPPSSPSNFKVVGNTRNSITIGWNRATDNVRVHGYEVYRADANGRNLQFLCKTIRVGSGDHSSLCRTFSGSKVGTDLAFTNTNLPTNSSYRYRINAYDKANNHSAATGFVTGATRYEAPSGTATSLVNGNFANTQNISFDWLQPFQVRDIGRWHMPTNGSVFKCNGSPCYSYRNDSTKLTYATQLVNLRSYDLKYQAYAQFELLSNEREKALLQHPQVLCIDFLTTSFSSTGGGCAYAIYKKGRQTITTDYFIPPSGVKYIRYYFGSHVEDGRDITKYRWIVRNAQIKTKTYPVPGCRQCAP